MIINLNKYPNPNTVHSIKFEKLDGGLNLEELDYRLESNESPEMENLLWNDGVLQSRDGQIYVQPNEVMTPIPGSSLFEPGKGYASTKDTFWGYVFAHVGRAIAFAKPDTTEMNFTFLSLAGTEAYLPKTYGTFFRYGDYLFYKTAGAFLKISYTPNDDIKFKVEHVSDSAYTPVTILNADPETGSGDMYQPENRINPKKEVHYNAKSDVTVYHLPVKGINSVVSVKVDGVSQTAGTDYSVDGSEGTVTFTTAPPVTDPPTNNTVEIVYNKSNDDAMNSIMLCEYAFVGGGNTDLCIILAGCDAQPNAVFWNSNDNVSMNPSYWPMSYYNLVGDTEDPVTGFGKQYSDLIVFKERSVGKLTYGVETVDDRSSISFAYQNINSGIGCNLPWSIQLIENNLVFANTYQGVFMVLSSSAAYENNIQCISRKVNGAKEKGLLYDVQNSSVKVSSFDDDKRYWLSANGHVYCWDYEVSKYSNPSWFYLTGIEGVSYFFDDYRNMYALLPNAKVSYFTRIYMDNGEPFNKVYRFPTQYFGGYERLKDIKNLIMATRSDTDTTMQVSYSTDYEDRADLTPIVSRSWRFLPRNLSHRCLGISKYAYIAKRKPGCRHVRHFAVTLSNNGLGEDLAIVSLEILYNFQGKER